MLQLRYHTPSRWAQVVIEGLDCFLQDHAANERKASAAAMRLLTQYPLHTQLVDAMLDVAREELEHFTQVYDLLLARGCHLSHDEPDMYMTKLHKCMERRNEQDYLLDQLLLSSVVEARGCERFHLLATALDPGPLQDFYADLARTESRHHALFLRLAREYFDAERVNDRLAAFLVAEADIVRMLPLRAALH